MPCFMRAVAQVRAKRKQQKEDEQSRVGSYDVCNSERSPKMTPPPPPRNPRNVDLPSGRCMLASARMKGEWPDGNPIGRGFASPYLQYEYARAISKRRKLCEGRPGGGWLVHGKEKVLVAPDDFVSFKISGRPGRVLIVRVLNSRACLHSRSSEHMLQPYGRPSRDSRLPGMFMRFLPAAPL